MMKREQILCDRCVNELTANEAKLEPFFVGAGTIREVEHMCNTCRLTATKNNKKYWEGYSKKRAKLIGDDTPAETE